MRDILLEEGAWNCVCIYVYTSVDRSLMRSNKLAKKVIIQEYWYSNRDASACTDACTCILYLNQLGMGDMDIVVYM